jgi:hypothetical protein
VRLLPWLDMDRGSAVAAGEHPLELSLNCQGSADVKSNVSCQLVRLPAGAYVELDKEG